jgi:hypothetical protein
MGTFFKWLLKWLALLIVLALGLVPYVASIWAPEYASEHPRAFSLWIAFGPLTVISLVISILYGRTRSIGEMGTQLFVLSITIASFYAFGWPKEIESDHMQEPFAELAVILVFFLLAELAAHLTKEATRISEKIDTSANTAVAAISEATRTALGQFSRVFDSVKPIGDEDIKEHVLERLSKYTLAWSGVLEPLTKDPISEANRAKLSCILAFFNAYLDQEIRDLGWTSSARPKKHIVMATNDDLYLNILKSVLKELEQCGCTRGFAWAITSQSCPI